MVRRGYHRNIRGHDDSDNPLYHSLKHNAEKIQKSLEDDYDKIFIVPDQEIFFIDGLERVVENATHAMKGEEEFVLIDNTWYSINHDTDKGITDVDETEFESQTYEDDVPEEQSSGIGILTTIIIALLIIGAIGYFILPGMAGAAGDLTQNKVPPTVVSSPLINAETWQPTTIAVTTNTPVPTPTQIEYFTRSYHWTYGGRSPTYVLKIPESLYQYYRNQPHNRNYVKYAISEKDRYILRDLVSDFKENTDSNTEAAHQVVAFVQSIPYSTDYISTGYNEYPRYPIETLVDGRGDCEDTAILTAALLKEMSYDVVLLSPPGHMAIGITCPACKGTSITIDNKKYYYLETTAEGWEVGQLPPKYHDDQVRYYRI